MAEYRQKTKQYIITATKQPIYVVRDGLALFNLNSCFPKMSSSSKLESSVRDMLLKGVKQVNIGNLASLCYRMELDYCSTQVYLFFKNIVDFMTTHGLEVVQKGIKSYGEIDSQPIDSLLSYDRKNNIIYTNSVLIECLKILGYVDNQIRDLVDITKDFTKIIPQDLIEDLPIVNEKTIKAYEKMRKLVNDSRVR